MPTAKKHSSVRARSNTASTAAKLERSPAGTLPAMPEGRDWHPETVRWWRDVWSSPMSREWDESDVHNVTICALLFDDIWTALSPTARKEAAGEYRLQRKDLGLTPYDRRRLEWVIESVDEVKDRGAQRRSRSTPKPRSAAKGDPRQVLRAVN